MQWSKLYDPVAGVHIKDPLPGKQVSNLKRKPIGFLCFQLHFESSVTGAY